MILSIYSTFHKRTLYVEGGPTYPVAGPTTARKDEDRDKKTEMSLSDGESETPNRQLTVNDDVELLLSMHHTNPQHWTLVAANIQTGEVRHIDSMSSPE